MADPLGLDVHDWQISHQVQLGVNGAPQKVTVLRFNVGPHGPFVFSYDDPSVTADRIRQDIQHHVSELRTIHMGITQLNQPPGKPA
jgi:hypothetical protein